MTDQSTTPQRTDRPLWRPTAVDAVVQRPPGRRGTATLRRALVAALAVVLSVPAILVIGTAPASALDASCTHRSMNANKGFTAYVTRSGVGFVGWRDYLNISAYDRCDHGRLRVGVSIYDANVRYKGGRVVIGSVRFQTTSSTTWQYLNRYQGTYLGTSTGYSVVYGDGGHLDLTRTTRITKVQLTTHLNFSGSVYAPRSYTCDVVNVSCS